MMLDQHGLTLATNACATDAARLALTVPHWLRTFGRHLRSIKIAIDPSPPQGRIAELHGGAGSLSEVQDRLDALCRLDRRICPFLLPQAEARDAELARWFKNGARPIRCQAQTPIAAFVAAIEAAETPLVLRMDCDMLFHEAGWLEKAADLLVSRELDCVEPARCGHDPMMAQNAAVSSRVFMIDITHWRSKILPMTAAKLDPVRRLHRFLQGRPPWLAFEQMLERARARGRFRFGFTPAVLGVSIHVATRQQAALPIMPWVAAAIEAGHIPTRQRAAGQNFDPLAWTFLQPPPRSHDAS